MNIWIVVADSASARVLSAEKPAGPLSEVTSLEHPESRLRENELTSDQPGRAFDSGGQGRHAMGTAVEPKQHEVIKFAKEVADYLEAGRNAQSFGKLYVIAAPGFLGHLRDHFPAPLTGLIAGSVNKNLTDRDIAEIRTHLPEFL